ncbi:MAG: isoprenylcysteine carboxylmethyltransferase family protein [Tenuifilaceae bacterium]
MALIEEMKKQGDFLFRFRGYLPIPLLIAGITVHVYNHLENPEQLPANYYFFICFAVGFFGLFIRSLTIGYTPKNTSGRNTKQQVADVVNTTEMYSIVRHPLYLGNYFMWLGLAMITYNILFIIIFSMIFWVYYERIMYAEEAYLRNKFGEPYLKWSESVPAFIPSIGKWKGSDAFFSFKNVLKREFTGLLKLVGLIFLFEYTHEIMINNYQYTQLSTIGLIWFYSFIGTLVLYLIIRAIRKKTSLLNVEGR